MNERKSFQYVKQRNGITLIALVISIIVMLILAGISLNAVIGDNGIITQAQNATYMQSVAVLEEYLNSYYVEHYEDGRLVEEIRFHSNGKYYEYSKQYKEDGSYRENFFDRYGGQTHSKSYTVDNILYQVAEYNPDTNEFKLDSKDVDFSKYHDFLMSENRYANLYNVNKKEAENILEQQKKWAINRYNYYKKLETDK